MNHQITLEDLARASGASVDTIRDDAMELVAMLLFEAPLTLEYTQTTYIHSRTGVRP